MTVPGGRDGEPWLDHDGYHVDVRGLEPPEPMVIILNLIERDDVGDCVTVHHDRDPVFLYPELAERGWQAQIVSRDAEEVRLLLTRGTR